MTKSIANKTWAFTGSPRASYVSSNLDGSTGPIGGTGTWFGDSWTYVGAAKLPAGTQGSAKLAYRDNYMVYDPVNNSVFASGGVSGSDTPYLAEFALPTLVNSTDIAALNTATVSQNFENVLNAAGLATGNTQGLNRITGGFISGTKLVLNANEWYDGPADNTHTTLVLDGKNTLSSATYKGYYEGDFLAKGAGWVTEIPAALQASLGGDVIFGYSSNDSIESRFSIGPSAYAVTLADVTGHAGSSGSFSSTSLMEFPLANPMADVNQTVANDYWTKMSRGVCGFIVPGTNTYAVVGDSGGNEFGCSYKTPNDAGETNGGWQSNIKADNYPYYWLFDVNDLIDAKNGVIQLHDIIPYEVGKLTLPFQQVTDATYQPDGFSEIKGAHFDAATSRLYLLFNRTAENDRPLAVYTITGAPR